jgi:hypothetical protein
MRRVVVGAVGMTVLAGACTGSTPPPPPPPLSHSRVTISSIREGASELSLLTGVGTDPQDPVQTGDSWYAFDISPAPGKLTQGGSPQVFLAKSQTSPVVASFRAEWHPFSGYARTGDRSPKTVFPGVYVAQVRIPGPGLWTVAVRATDGGDQAVGVGHVYAAAEVQNGVGSKAISVGTPVGSGARLGQICTRTPPDPMHYISLDRALGNGKPTVVVFSTPALCESQLCGPVTDEVLLLFQKYGPEKANFVHVEEFLPGADLKPPTPTFAHRAPAFKAWGLETEPWVFVIDSKGVIRARFQYEAVAPAIESALRALL